MKKNLWAAAFRTVLICGIVTALFVIYVWPQIDWENPFASGGGTLSGVLVFLIVIAVASIIFVRECLKERDRKRQEKRIAETRRKNEELRSKVRTFDASKEAGSKKSWMPSVQSNGGTNNGAVHHSGTQKNGKERNGFFHPQLAAQSLQQTAVVEQQPLMRSDDSTTETETAVLEKPAVTQNTVEVIEPVEVKQPAVNGVAKSFLAVTLPKTSTTEILKEEIPKAEPQKSETVKVETPQPETPKAENDNPGSSNDLPEQENSRPWEARFGSTLPADSGGNEPPKKGWFQRLSGSHWFFGGIGLIILIIVAVVVVKAYKRSSGGAKTAVNSAAITKQKDQKKNLDSLKQLAIWKQDSIETATELQKKQERAEAVAKKERDRQEKERQEKIKASMEAAQQWYKDSLNRAVDDSIARAKAKKKALRKYNEKQFWLWALIEENGHLIWPAVIAFVALVLIFISRRRDKEHYSGQVNFKKIGRVTGMITLCFVLAWYAFNRDALSLAGKERAMLISKLRAENKNNPVLIPVQDTTGWNRFDSLQAVIIEEAKNYQRQILDVKVQRDAFARKVDSLTSVAVGHKPLSPRDSTNIYNDMARRFKKEPEPKIDTVKTVVIKKPKVDDNSTETKQNTTSKKSGKKQTRTTAVRPITTDYDRGMNEFRKKKK
jgi:hypothetical protein